MISAPRTTRLSLRFLRIGAGATILACAAILAGCEAEKTRDDIRVDPQRVDPERSDETLPMHGVEAPKKGWFD